MSLFKKIKNNLNIHKKNKQNNIVSDIGTTPLLLVSIFGFIVSILLSFTIARHSYPYLVKYVFVDDQWTSFMFVVGAELCFLSINYIMQINNANKFFIILMVSLLFTVTITPASLHTLRLVQNHYGDTLVAPTLETIKKPASYQQYLKRIEEIDKEKQQNELNIKNYPNKIDYYLTMNSRLDNERRSKYQRIEEIDKDIENQTKETNKRIIKFENENKQKLFEQQLVKGEIFYALFSLFVLQISNAILMMYSSQMIKKLFRLLEEKQQTNKYQNEKLLFDDVNNITKIKDINDDEYIDKTLLNNSKIDNTQLESVEQPNIDPIQTNSENYNTTLSKTDEDTNQTGNNKINTLDDLYNYLNIKGLGKQTLNNFYNVYRIESIYGLYGLKKFLGSDYKTVIKNHFKSNNDAEHLIEFCKQADQKI